MTSRPWFSLRLKKECDCDLLAMLHSDASRPAPGFARLNVRPAPCAERPARSVMITRTSFPLGLPEESA